MAPFTVPTRNVISVFVGGNCEWCKSFVLYAFSGKNRHEQDCILSPSWGILSPSCFAILQLCVSFQYFIFLDCAILIKYLYTMLSVAGKYTAIDTPKTHINKLISLHKSRQYLSLLFRKKDKYTFWPFEIEHFKCIVSFFFESILSPLFIKWQNLY